MANPDHLPPPTSLDESFSSLNFGGTSYPSRGSDAARVRVSIDGDDGVRSSPDTERDPEGAINSVSSQRGIYNAPYTAKAQMIPLESRRLVLSYVTMKSKELTESSLKTYSTLITRIPNLTSLLLGTSLKLSYPSTHLPPSVSPPLLALHLGTRRTILTIRLTLRKLGRNPTRLPLQRP